MEHNQDNFLDWAKDGKRIACNIFSTAITDAKLSYSDGSWYICQNKEEGYEAIDKKGYKYSWCIFDGEASSFESESVTNIRPSKCPKEKSHNRKVSPSIEEVGSCILLKKWKWLTYDNDTFFLWTHKPVWEENNAEWVINNNCGDFTEMFDGLFKSVTIPENDSECIWRRQNNKWVNIGK